MSFAYAALRASRLPLLSLGLVLSSSVCAEEAADAAADSNDIVVTATGFEMQAIEAPASISVISRERLEEAPYRQITDALLDVPGVSITPGEGNSRDISIRGMGANYTLILVDGRRLNSRRHAQTEAASPKAACCRRSSRSSASKLYVADVLALRLGCDGRRHQRHHPSRRR
ncbi:TonB-dependent receptor plug domain-containing protein [Novosphingobium panipatense]